MTGMWKARRQKHLWTQNGDSTSAVLGCAGHTVLDLRSLQIVCVYDMLNILFGSERN